jgi:putative endonuclease
MSFFVYIIQSAVDGSFYKGFSENPKERLLQHNNHESSYTSTKGPWTLVYLEAFSTKKEALIRERAIKKYGHDRIQRLIISPKNVMDGFRFDR